MGARFHNARYPRYSIKSICGSPCGALKRLWRRQIRARQKAAMKKDPERPAVKEDTKLQKMDLWY